MRSSTSSNDTVYYPCLEETRGRPSGPPPPGRRPHQGPPASSARITTGLGWEQVTDVVEVAGAVDEAAREACTNLGGVVAATIGGT